MKKKSILIIGNGHTSKWEDKNKINYNLCQFLSNLQNPSYYLKWAQVQKIEKNITGLNTSLIPEKIKIIQINKRSIFNLLNLCYEILKSDFVYIFFPGTKGYWIAIFCYIFSKKYGIYIRGLLNVNSRYLKFCIKYSFINNVVQGLGQELSSVYSNINIIKPMTGIFNQSASSDLKFTRYINKKPQRFIFVGRIERDKGVFELIEAFKNLSFKYKNIKLSLIGIGTAFGEIKRRINKIHYSNISLEGLISDLELLKEIYKSADVLILPTYHEGFPRALYEAGSFGIVLISTSVGGIPYALSPGSDFLEIEPKSVTSIIDAVDKIMIKDSLRKKLMKNSFMTTRFMKENYSEHHELLLKKFLELKLL